jgi:sialate O-acetylesterase
VYPPVCLDPLGRGEVVLKVIRDLATFVVVLKRDLGANAAMLVAGFQMSPKHGDFTMSFIRPLSFLCFGLLSACGVSRAEVRLPHALGDHAVLQRERPIHIWGWATPGAHLQASFHGQTVPAVADRIGKFSLWLKPEAAGGPYVLSITGDGPEKQVTDLLVGDVWFASGQSNMEIPLSGFPGNAVIKNAAKEIAGANNPRISDYPLDDIGGDWDVCTPESAKDFSAVAYFFGREIAAKENVPIGLIDSTWGGTPADAWVSLDTLGTDAQLLPAIASRARFSDHLADVDGMALAETREDNAAKAAGKPLPTHPWHPFQSSWSPAGLYNGMIAPLTPMSIKGFLWYQGETNSGAGRAQYYRTLFPALIEDWRMQFAQGNLPFLFVQISSFNSLGEDWGQVRDAQRRTLSVANTAMAVTLDVGEKDNVHPPDKQTVAYRLALAARATVYGEKIAYASPLFREATHELLPNGTNAMRVWFDHGEGLNAPGSSAVGGQALGFEIAGANHQFVAAQATIEGTSVLVSAPSVASPLYVRFGWSSWFPTNLYNATGLPASTFTSDESVLP